MCCDGHDCPLPPRGEPRLRYLVVKQLLVILGLLAPILLPLLAFVLTPAKNFGWRASATIAASLLSLPLSATLLVVGYDARAFRTWEAFADAATPTIQMWPISFILTIATLIFAAVRQRI